MIRTLNRVECLIHHPEGSLQVPLEDRFETTQNDVIACPGEKRHPVLEPGL
jgi:hypothetical protein